ncbi:hypothetical protein [Calothrix sp. NIES-3974]|uniref:hypothetical protein n=1 Tax=Calothrix sp. NIES-3974 TaxID=2005462 RepID=UPI000B60BC98|nr:hypothetical protein [Calothrix sp. NIES-3974]BAZ07753.1 hypothetical protein NIES3974_44180 [Calothrix sp. NIES-3974]
MTILPANGQLATANYSSKNSYSAPAIANNLSSTSVKTKSGKPADADKKLPEKIMNQIHRRAIADYAGQVEKIVEAKRVSYPFHCDELGANRNQPITCNLRANRDTWKVTVDTYFERLVYYVRDTGTIKLGSREYLGKANKLPGNVEKILLADAQKNWDLLPNRGQIVSVRASLEPSAEDFTALPIKPHFSDANPSNRFWEVIIADGNSRWIYFVNQKNPRQFKIWSQVNYDLKSKITPEQTLALISRVTNNFQVKPGEVLLTKVENIQVDGCFGLAAPWEACTMASLPALRVTIKTKNQQTAVYRIRKGRDASVGNYEIALEGIKNMPPRTDDLPNDLAEKIIRNASKRLRTPTQNLRIPSDKIQISSGCSSANVNYYGKECWMKVFVTNGQNYLAYTFNDKLGIVKVEVVSAP